MVIVKKTKLLEFCLELLTQSTCFSTATANSFKTSLNYTTGQSEFYPQKKFKFG